MGKKLDNVINLYLEGIRDGNIREAVTKYTGDRYTQHSTGVKDGIDGFVEFFEGFVKRCPQRDIQIIRGFEDGRYVFVQAFQDINDGEAKWVTTDLFDTDSDNKIVEHWDVISAFQEETANSHTQIDGATEITDLDKTEENKALVRSFIVDVFQNKNHQNIEKYISTETYIQHNSQVANGIDAVRGFLANVNFNYDFVFNVIGQGNFVASYSKVTLEGTEMAVFDIFRIENGLIVEHWDNMEEILPRKEWANSGKF